MGVSDATTQKLICFDLSKPVETVGTSCLLDELLEPVGLFAIINEMLFIIRVYWRNLL